MKTEYEYIKFIQVLTNGKTSKWRCCNKHYGEELGIVKWYGGWRQYCYFPSGEAVYSAVCLADIKSFLDELKYEYKPKLTNRYTEDTEVKEFKDELISLLKQKEAGII